MARGLSRERCATPVTFDPNDFIPWPGFLSDIGINEPGFPRQQIPGTGIPIANPPTVFGAAITTVVGAATGGVDNVFGDFSLGGLAFASAAGDLEVTDVVLSDSSRRASGSRSDYEIGIEQDLDGLAAIRTRRPAEGELTIPSLPSITLPALSASVSWPSIRADYRPVLPSRIRLRLARGPVRAAPRFGSFLRRRFPP